MNIEWVRTSLLHKQFMNSPTVHDKLAFMNVDENYYFVHATMFLCTLPYLLCDSSIRVSQSFATWVQW